MGKRSSTSSELTMTDDHNDSSPAVSDTVLCFRLYVYIPRGRRNVITKRELCKLCGIEPNDTNLRRIARLRDEVQRRFCVLVAFCNDGYYIAETPKGEQEGMEYRENQKAGWDRNIESYNRVSRYKPIDQSFLDEF